MNRALRKYSAGVGGEVVRNEQRTAFCDELGEDRPLRDNDELVRPRMSVRRNEAAGV